MPDIGLFMSLGIFVAGALLGFASGRASVQYPDEDVMFERLVTARANRKIEATTRSDLKTEIDYAAEKRTNLET